MLNIVPFGAAVLEKILKHLPIYHYVKVYGHGAGPYIILGTSFEQPLISWS